MGQPRHTLDDIEAIIASTRRTEAFKRSYVECEAILRAMVERGEDRPRALRLRAELAAKRRHWDEAVEHWQRFLSEVDAPDVGALLKLAGACRRAGRLAEAREALKQARRHGLEDSVFRRARRRLRGSLRIQREAALGRRVARAMLGEADEDPVSVYAELLRKRRMTQPGAEALLALMADLSRLAKRGGGLARPGERNVPWMRFAWRGLFAFRLGGRDESAAPIFSCGFGFSGSGAVTDFLRDHHDCDLPFGRVELPWFHGNRRRGVTGATHLLAHAGAARTDEYTWHVLDFFLSCVLGLPGLATPDVSGAAFVRRKRTAMLRSCVADGVATTSFTACARHLLEGLAQVRNRAGAESLLRAFFSQYFALCAGPKRRAVLDNCIKAHELPLLRLVPRARAVITRRDPRDQFAARAKESENGAVSADVFVNWFRERERRYRVARLHPLVRGRVHEVSFERFVLESAPRDGLREWLALDGAVDAEGQFHPEESRANIGIHRDWPNRRDIQYIEKKLRRYLVEEAD